MPESVARRSSWNRSKKCSVPINQLRGHWLTDEGADGIDGERRSTGKVGLGVLTALETVNVFSYTESLHCAMEREERHPWVRAASRPVSPCARASWTGALAQDKLDAEQKDRLIESEEAEFVAVKE